MPGSSPGMTSGVSRSEVAERFAQTPTSFSQPHCLLTQFYDLATRCARAVHLSSAPLGGRGECRVPDAPAAPCAKVESTGVEATGPPESPGIPARNGFNSLCRALPGDRALLPPSPADMFCLSPVGPTQLRELDASVGASGPHDFAVRNNISRQHAGDRSRVFRLALRSPCAQNAAASTATHPAFLTIMTRPLCGVGCEKF